MPQIQIAQADLVTWGQTWMQGNAFTKKEGMDFGEIFDAAVGDALAQMLGGINIDDSPGLNDIMPKERDIVEVGPVRVIGGIRPQNYDVGYRPDGARFVCDSKTLNDDKSVGKNFQNMVNDLGTEATTVHMRFPYAVATFVVVIPEPCFTGMRRQRFTPMLERLGGRDGPDGPNHVAEALALILWDPATGTIDAAWPPPGSHLRIEEFSTQVEEQYRTRYEGLPPHHKP